MLALAIRGEDMSTKRLLKLLFPCVIAVIMLAMLLTGCSSGSEDKLIEIREPVEKATYYIYDGTENYYYQDHTTTEQAVNEFADSIEALRTYIDGESFVDTGYYMGVNYAIDLLDEQNNTAGNFQLRVHAYLFTYPYEDENGNPIYKYYENGNYYDENNPEGTRKLVNALEIHNQAIKKSDISIEWYNGATNEVMIGLYFDGINSNSDDPGNILYADIQGARRSFPEFGDTVLYQQMIRLLVHLSVEGLLSGVGLQSDAGTGKIRELMPALVGESYKRTVNDDIVSLLFYSLSLPVKDQANRLLKKLFGPFEDKWDPLTYKYLGFRFSSVSTASVQNMTGDMQSIISPDKENVNNVLTNAIFHLTGVVRERGDTGAPYDYTCDVTFDYGWTYPESGLEILHKDWYKPFEYGQYEFKGKLYVPAWDAQYDALVRTDMNSEDNTTNNVFIEFRDIANGELAIGIYYKNERSYLDITGLEYMYGWIDLEYLGFPQVYDEHLDLAHALKRFKITVNNVIVSIVDGILSPATSDKENNVLEDIMAKTSMTEKIEFTTEQQAEYRQLLLGSDIPIPWETLKEISEIPYEDKWEGMTVRDIEAYLKNQTYDDNYIRNFIEEKVIYSAVLLKKQESLFSANTEILDVDITLIKQMLEETGAGTFTTRQLITVVDSVLPYTLDQLAIMLGIPSAELMVEKTYFTFILDVDTNLMTMIMKTDLGVPADEPSKVLWQLELTPTHFGERVPIADIDFSKFKPLEQIYTYSGTLRGNFVFSSQETVDMSKLLSATFGESSGLNTPYILDNNAGLHFDLIYDQFVTDNYVNDEGIPVDKDDPTAIFKEEGRSAFDLTLRLMGVDGDEGIIIRLSSDSVSFNNEVYKKLSSTNEKERSEAEHAMGYVWVHIPCVKKNGEQAVPKLKVREDVFMASMSAYMNGETAINDDVSSFADNDFNLSLTSIISALCKDAYVVPEPEQMEITSSNDTLQSLFRVKGLIGNIAVDAGFTYRVKGLQAIKPQYYMYQVGVFKDITGDNPYTTTLHETLRTHFYQDFRDEYEPLDYDFYVFSEDIVLEDGTRIEEGTIKVFELGAKKYISRQAIPTPKQGDFFSVEPAENQDLSLIKFALTDLTEIVKYEQDQYFYTTYYGKIVEIKEEYIETDMYGNVFIYWQGLRDVLFYDEGENYYYFDRQMSLLYKETDEEKGHYFNEPVYIFKEQYRKLLFEYDADSVEITAFCKTQYSPRTNGSFMGQVRRYYLLMTSSDKTKLGALHSVYYGGDENTFPPQYYSEYDRTHSVEVYDDDGILIDWYYDPIALFVMEPAEPLKTEYRFYVCTDRTLTTNIDRWTPENLTPHVRCKWEKNDNDVFPCRFIIDWDQVTLKGYFVITELIVAEGTMGETVFPCRIIVTNREIDTQEKAVVYDKDNYIFQAVSLSNITIGDTIPEKTYYVLSGDGYVLTSDKRFVEGTTYYQLKYYEANVPVVDSIEIDPYEYLLAKYKYLSDKNNFTPTEITSKEDYLEQYAQKEQEFINAYFSQYVFDISFAWEQSILNRDQDDYLYNETLKTYELVHNARVQTEYIAKSYTNRTVDENGDESLELYNWSFDVYEYGDNLEKIIKPAGGAVYLHTRFHGQLIALRVDVGVRNFAYVEFNIYNSDGMIEDTFNPDDYPGYSGKYTANYYDNSSYVLGTQPTFVFTDDRGMEHRIIFDMAYISGLDTANNYIIEPSYNLNWSDKVITNVGSDGSYFMEYVYEKLYSADSLTGEVRPITEIGIKYEELTDEQKAATVTIDGVADPVSLYVNAGGYAKVLKADTYQEESIVVRTYGGKNLAYNSLTTDMKATMVNYYDNAHGELESGRLYENVDGYAFKRVIRTYKNEYVDLVSYDYMPMGSDTYSLPLTELPVYYSGTGNNLALTEEQQNVKVAAEGGTRNLYADSDRDGFAEKLNPSVYDNDLYDVVVTSKGEIVPYKSLSDEQKDQRVRTENGETLYLYRDVDGHAEKRRATRYSSVYAPYKLFSFTAYNDFNAYFVSYSDLSEAEKAQTVTLQGGDEIRLYKDDGGLAKTLIPVYRNEKETFTVSGKVVFYDRLTDEMKEKTVDVDGTDEKLPLYYEDADGYAKRLRISYYPDAYEYETYVRYEIKDSVAVDHDAEVLLYTDFYQDNLFRVNEKTGKVEIRKASVYLPDKDGDDSYYLLLELGGSVMPYSSNANDASELSRTVTVNGEKEEQPYIVKVDNSAAIRLGYWYTENEWEEFRFRNTTYTWDQLSAEMKAKRVYVRLKDYTVDIFRLNDGTSNLLPLYVGSAIVAGDLSDAEKTDLYAIDGAGNAYIPVGGYYLKETWVQMTLNGIPVNYADLSFEEKNQKVNIIRYEGNTATTYDILIGTGMYTFEEEKDYLIKDEGGVAYIRKLQPLIEIRKMKEAGTGAVDLSLAETSAILYSDLSAAERNSGIFSESPTHGVRIKTGGYYYENEWLVFTVKKNAYQNFDRFSTEMQAASGVIRPSATSGKLYKGNNQGYALLRDRSFAAIGEYFTNENLWVEYGKGKVALFLYEKEGLSVRSDEKQLINRPFYVYYELLRYDANNKPVYGNAVYLGSEYQYRYQQAQKDGEFIKYEDLTSAQKAEGITNDAGDFFPTYLPSVQVDENGYYDRDAEYAMDTSIYAYKRIDVTLISTKSYEFSTATLDFYNIFRLYTAIEGKQYPISVITGKIIENEKPGESTQTEYQSLVVRILAECPKQEPRVLSEGIKDQLDDDDDNIFYATDVTVGSDRTSSSVDGYYRVDPLREGTFILPDTIVVRFEGGSSHVFSGLEWFVTYDETTGKRSGRLPSSEPGVEGKEVIRLLEDGSYRVMLSPDEEVITKIMTCIGNSTSGYKYITVALQMLSKSPKSIDFYLDSSSDIVLPTEQYDVLVTDATSSVTKTYYKYYVNTFTGVELPSYIVAHFSTHDPDYEIAWTTTTGEEIVYKPNTTLHLVSDIREWMTVEYATLEKMEWDRIQEKYSGWIIYTVYNDNTAITLGRDEAFLDVCTYNQQNEEVTYSIGKFTSVLLYRKVDLEIHLDIVVENYQLVDLQLPAASQKNSIFDKYVLVRSDEEAETKTCEYSELVTSTMDSLKTMYTDWLIDTIQLESGSIEEGFRGVPLLSVITYSGGTISFSFASRFTRINLVKDDKRYVRVSRLVQWSPESADTIGLYFVNEDSKKQYVVISTGSSGDKEVALSRIGLFTFSETDGYKLDESMPIQTFLNQVYNIADITVRQREFNYDLSYTQVESYSFDKDNPTDQTNGISYENILSYKIKFVSYDSLSGIVQFSFAAKQEGTSNKCVKVVNGMVTLSNGSGDTTIVSFTDLISMAIANELQKDIRSWRVRNVVQSDGTVINYPGSPLSDYTIASFGSGFKTITLEKESESLTCSRAELEYRLDYLKQHVLVTDKDVKITDKTIRIENLSAVMNVNDMISYDDHGVSRQITVDTFNAEQKKYRIPLGTGLGAYDMNVILTFRNGFYYDYTEQGFAEIIVEPYDSAGSAQYASGYNFGEKIIIDRLIGVKVLNGESYTGETREDFSYGPGGREQLNYWYVRSSSIAGIEVGSLISRIPPEIIYRTGTGSSGNITISTVTSEGFYLVRTLRLEGLPEAIDSNTADSFNSVSSSASETFVIQDGVITIKNIYEYDTEKGIAAYFATTDYLPKTLVLTVGGKSISVNGVNWTLSTSDWLNISGGYDNLSYRGTNGPTIFATAFVLGYRSSASSPISSQIKLTVRLNVLSTEIETFSLEDSAIGLETDTYFVTEDNGEQKWFAVYVDPYNDSSSSAFENDAFYLPTAFDVYTVGNPEKFGFSNVMYNYNDRVVTKIFYTLKGIDVEKMMEKDSELDGTGFNNNREITLFAYIGNDPKVRQTLYVKFYFYDKEAKLTEAVFSIADDTTRNELKTLLANDKTQQQEELLKNINVNRLKSNLEMIMSEAQKLQSDIVANRLVSAEIIVGALTKDGIEKIIWDGSGSVKGFSSLKYSNESLTDSEFLATVDGFAKTKPWSKTQCRDFAVYYIKASARQELTETYSKMIYDSIRQSAGATTMLKNVTQNRQKFIADYASAAYIAIIKAYMEIEFTTAFTGYLTTDVDDEMINNSIRYKNIVEGLFDIEELLANVRKLNRLLAYGNGSELLTLYAKQFDFTNAKHYGYYNEQTISEGSLVRALIIEQIYKAIYAADQKFGIKVKGEFDQNVYKTNNELWKIRQTVVESLFARVGMIENYLGFTAVSFDEGTELPDNVYYLDENGFIVPEEERNAVAGRLYFREAKRVDATGVAVSDNDLINALLGSGTTSEKRNAIDAIVTRWFNFYEAHTETAMKDFFDLGSDDVLIKYSFASIDRYINSVNSLKNNLFDGTDGGSMITDLVTKATSSFLDLVFVENKIVTSIRQIKELNADREVVYVDPYQSTYQKYTDYYVIEKATPADALYEQNEEGYYYLSKDTSYNETKSYYKFTLQENVETGGNLPTEKVYVKAEGMFASSEATKYYRFIPVKVIESDSGDEIFQAGDQINGDYYYNDRTRNRYCRTTDAVFDSAYDYYKFIYTETLSSQEQYYSLVNDSEGDYYVATDMPVLGNAYLIRTVHIVSSAQSVCIFEGPESQAVDYLIADRWYYDENNQMTSAFYECRADGKMYLTKDVSFITGHTYYARMQMVAGIDYDLSSSISTWEESGMIAYTETTQYSVYNRTALYVSDIYYLYNTMVSSYIVEFDEATGGSAYKKTVSWLPKSTGDDYDYNGGSEKKSYSLIAGGASVDSQTLTQEWLIKGHVLDESELVVRDAVAEMARKYLQNKKTSSGAEVTLTGYNVVSYDPGDSTGTIKVARIKDGKQFYISYYYWDSKYVFDYMDGYDSEGYLLYRFENTYDMNSKQLLSQAISIFNPFEFSRDQLPSLIYVGETEQKIVWESASILPQGNLNSSTHEIKGHVINENGQLVKMNLYVASWAYTGISQPTDQVTDVKHMVGDKERYFVYLGGDGTKSINCYFSLFSAYSAVDCYLVDFSVKILRNDGKVYAVTLKADGTVDFYNMNDTSNVKFVKKLFYPYMDKTSINISVDYTSRLLSYGDEDESVSAVQNRRNYLLYWDGSPLVNAISAIDIERKIVTANASGDISLGNERIGSSTLTALLADNDTTTPINVTYYVYGEMSIEELQLMPSNVEMETELIYTGGADPDKIMTFEMPYYKAYFTVTNLTTGTCSVCGKSISIERSGTKYTMACPTTDCRIHKNGHRLVYDSATGKCKCEGTECLCSLYAEFENELSGKSGQVPLIMDVYSTYPETGVITIAEGNIPYEPSEMNVRLLWNQDYETVIANLIAFVKETYKEIDSSARELYARKLLLNWPKMSESEKNDIIKLATEYCKTLKTTMDVNTLLAINERYDFVNKPERLAGGGDVVQVTVLILMEGSYNMFISKKQNVKVIFKDYQSDILYQSATAFNPITERNLELEAVTISSTMIGTTIPQNTYFVQAQNEEYVLTAPSSKFENGKTYYRKKTSVLYFAAPGEYWKEKEGGEWVNIYEYSNDKNVPYDNVGDAIYKLLDYTVKTEMETSNDEGLENGGIKYKMITVSNVYWTLSGNTYTSASFDIIVGGKTLRINSTLLTFQK